MLATSEYQLKQYLYDINNNRRDEAGNRASTLEIFAWFVAKEKAIYNALNMTKSRGVNYIGFLWSPIEHRELLQNTISAFESTEFKQLERNGEKHLMNPPTYIKTNDVTFVFQEITNTYGVPMYKEANPTIFAIVTFPFLFAVMFGDYGHGSLILTVGTFLVMAEPSLRGTSLAGALPLRYLFFMMGFFACFTGLLYNEWFAIPADWFGTCFDLSQRECTSENENTCNAIYMPLHCNVNDYNAGTDCINNCVYGFGVDPAWAMSPQLLTYTNNIKMKLSVIIGVIHMSIGVCVKGMNSLYFHRMLDFWFEVVIGLIILLGMFGWMDLLIFGKWSYVMDPYSTEPSMIAKINNCPSIITVMINNFLAGGYPDPHPGPQNLFFPHQILISEILVVVVLISVPLLLCVKPLSLIYCCKPHHAAHQEFVDV